MDLIPIASTRQLLRELTAGDNTSSRQLVKTVFSSGLPDYNPLLRRCPERALHVLASVDGEALTLKAVGRCLLVCLSRFNVKHKPDVGQLADLAAHMVDSSPQDSITLEDIVIFSELASRQHFGKVYDRLDYAILFDWFERYRQERYEAKLANHEAAHAARKQEGRRDDKTDSEKHMSRIIRRLNDYLKK